MATAQHTRTAVGAPRRVARQLKSALRHSFRAGPCTIFLNLFTAGMAIASHPTFFRKNIASNYCIKTTKKIASVIALQNLTKKICDFFDFFVFNSSISFFCLVIR